MRERERKERERMLCDRRKNFKFILIFILGNWRVEV